MYSVRTADMLHAYLCTDGVLIVLGFPGSGIWPETCTRVDCDTDGIPARGVIAVRPTFPCPRSSATVIAEPKSKH